MDQNNHSGASESSLTDRTSIDIKQFELILGQEGDVEDHEFWEEMWRVVPGLSPAELNFLRKELARDFEKIETGQFQLPIYADDLVSSESNPSNSQGNATAVVGKKKKGIPWSEEEKALFVKGLEKYGKGHWKEISQHFVTSRTPTQVASYAQKFFLAEKKRLKRLGISDLPPHRHQESSPASHFPIPSTFQIPPQQQGLEAPFLAPDYLLGNNLFYGEQNLQNFISLPPFQFDLQAQALPPSQFNQRVHHGALVPDPACRLEHQSHQTDCMNQRQHLMHSRNSTQHQFYQQHQSHQTDCMNQRQHLMHSRNSTQLQFYQQTHAEPLFGAQQTLDELQSRTRLVNFQIVDPWYITSSNPTPRSGSDSFPSPTAQQAPAPNSRMDQNHKNTDKPY